MLSHSEIGRNLGTTEKVKNYGHEVWKGSGTGYGRKTGDGGVMGLRDGWMIGLGPPFATWVEGKEYASLVWLRARKWKRLPTWNRGVEENHIEAERRCLMKSVIVGVSRGSAPSQELTCDPEGLETATDRGGYDERGLACCNATTYVQGPVVLRKIVTG